MFTINRQDNRIKPVKAKSFNELGFPTDWQQDLFWSVAI